jgi:hypothetical protein
VRLEHLIEQVTTAPAAAQADARWAVDSEGVGHGYHQKPRITDIADTSWVKLLRGFLAITSDTRQASLHSITRTNDPFTTRGGIFVMSGPSSNSATAFSSAN